MGALFSGSFVGSYSGCSVLPVVHRVLTMPGTAQALIATADLHSADEAAKRVLPAVAPLTVDTVADVRTHALMVLDRYQKTLKEEHKRLLAVVQAAGAEEAQPGGAGRHF